MSQAAGVDHIGAVSSPSGVRSAAPADTLPVQCVKGRRFADNALCHGDGVGQLVIRQIPDRRAFDDRMPWCAERAVKADAHETMVQRHRPVASSGHSGKGFAHEDVPLRDKRCAICSIITFEWKFRLLL